MPKYRLSKCPVCGGKLNIVKYRCEECGTEITGNFELEEFAQLTNQQLNFLKIFIKVRGNLSELQKELGISYPTAKARLEEVATAMGYESENIESREKTLEILEKIEKGEITPEEAKELLKKYKK
ncbi:conserved hypothetical protein [Petrotoga mobilis SJ95]|jgi:hypothetical protein|uniref:DUF2089 domain-containing protein n=1 Tax=Petrotoga mobilis (strain DSM 10674 / SJ95) TaxID=403833 RepID=A9BIB4_PETMO|nr:MULTISPECIES: DUF2089 domain-containing protein [Petrotoga]MDK2811961.1 hypothetical protein [Petrotoga sp.]ABX32405.1 conserved hypothetical protein [Petrotoga mobilis SJ95]MBL5981576.1 hypothetical protein [Petrotoga sp. 8T1HF07.NaAc.6.1]PNR87721.1 hypothetical protein X925_08655 [Petrotoga sp. 9T1HF07.CasAA.8.2]PNR92192.1 hypothetical protein X926_06845 [Petrotoga sp. HWHPT.55.6.3]